MSPLVTRTVSLVPPQDDRRFGPGDVSLANFRSDRGYVLLGEPGMGKTTALQDEALRVGGTFVEVRRFLSRAPEHHPEWRNTILFLDGLDEVRVGAGDPRTPLDRLIARLEVLGNPSFRLSCRAGSWLDPGDARELASLTGAGEPSNTEGFRVLMLDPLSHDDVLQIVSSRREDAEGFIADAFNRGLETFLWNPQLLKVLLDAVEASGWPDSPRGAFEIACQELVRERNPEHRDARRGSDQPPQDAVLGAAGRLSALLLLTDKGGWSATDSDDPDILSLLAVDAEDDHEADGGRKALPAAVDSRLFAGTTAVRRPTHRLFAEFLGARYLDRRMRAPGRPITRRVLSLLFGHDGVPLPDLRGLAAWLAALNPDARSLLIRADPTSVAFDGDASDFTPEERRQLLAELELSPRLPSMWPSAAALGALARGGGRNPLRDLIASPTRTDARQTLVSRLLAGRTFRTALVDRGPRRLADNEERKPMLGVIYDDTWRIDVRCNALKVLDQLLADDPGRGSALRNVLSDIEAGRLADEDHELRGTLLSLMYPRDIPPAEIWNHFVVRRHLGVTVYSQFWQDLLDKSSPEQVRQLLESLCDRAEEVIPTLVDDNFGTIVLELLARSLELFGDKTTETELHRWFGLVDAAPNRSGLIPAHCGATLPVDFFPEFSDRIYAWLSSREPTRHALIELGLSEREDEAENTALDQSIGRKLVGEEAPAGFRRWCLTRAAELADSRPKVAEELARWAVRRNGWGPPLSDNEVALAARDSPMLREWNTRRLQAKPRGERERTPRCGHSTPLL